MPDAYNPTIKRQCKLCFHRGPQRVIRLWRYYGRDATAECLHCGRLWRVRLSKREILSYRYGIDIKEPPR